MNAGSYERPKSFTEAIEGTDNIEDLYKVIEGHLFSEFLETIQKAV